jgi:glucose-6-phosphate 1-dehydrogenase
MNFHMDKKFDPHKKKEAIPPTVLTIFGATGDLSADYLLPALLHMQDHGLLPKTFKLVCVGRRDFDSEKYLKFIISKSSVLKKLSKKTKQAFLKHLIYFKGDFENLESFAPLAKVLEDSQGVKHLCYNRLYYFATSPQYFSSIAKILKDTGLLTNCTEHKRQTRILVEKPFGFNLKSAQSLNSLLLKYFKEEQIYRIDHYQGKETVQNLMVARFANSIFEPLWNKEYIDHVEISALEKDTAKSRAQFYDDTGALKDFVQNHLLQMLSLIAMDEPKELTTEYIRDEKFKILNSLIAFNADSVLKNIVKGQYLGYAKDIGKESETETYVAVKAFLNTPRWSGVPFYLRTGKALKNKVGEVSIHFKEPVRCLFQGCGANVLTFRIQPDESVHLQINNKIPGFGIHLHKGNLDFSYQKAFAGEIPSAYERLLLDFMEGDQRLFIRSDEIEAAWKFVDSILENWKKAPLYKYKKGSTGPKEAEEFMTKEFREWQTK